jgi:hypothetical protein
MRLFLSFVILLFLSGCCLPITKIEKADYNHARRATIEAWEHIIGRVSLKCEQELREAWIAEVLEVHGSTPDRELAGKVFVKQLGQEITEIQIHILLSMSELQKMDTAVHEFIHALAACEYLDIDPGRLTVQDWIDSEHLNSLYWIEYGPDTVEAWGCANL